ncbi:MAG: ribosomal protein S18-alanine N-acetyltransferase [Deltaproteobacteria bacterium]|nr:ribosomal protein S18-alanine N-acetyltransferase [Deltaproteobacteria bacterium]
MVVEKRFLENIVSVGIRRAGPDDLDSIQEVENGSYDHPWSGGLLKEGMDNPRSLSFVATDGLDHGIRGFILNLLVVDELHVLNIAVLPAYRRRGIGNSLLVTSINAAKQLGATAVFLEVRRSNIKALTLYIQHDFKVIGVRRGYYSDNGEDALVMKKSL